jgi:ABC-type lipoprotein release transport system permease subunit
MVALQLRRDLRGAAFSASGVAIGVGALVFFVALGLGVGRVVRERIFPADASLVDVVPPRLSLGAIVGGGTLDQPAIDRLAALPGVAAVHRKMQVRVPAVSRYDGAFFGANLRMGVEVLAVGVDRGLVDRDVQLGAFEDPGPGQPIPAVMSSRLLEIYNRTFAPARRLPQLSPSMVVGFTFPIELNRSYVAGQAAPGPTTSAQAQVVGVSDRAILAGLTIPLETARRINRAAGLDAATYTGVTLQARDPSSVPSIVEEVKRMGLGIDDQERRLSENAGAAVAVTTSALALLSILICALAGVNIAHALFAQVRGRSREIGILRAVGASRADVRRIVLAEAAAVGALGGLGGTLLAVAFALAVDGAARRWLPPFPFKPESFFQFPAGLLVGGLALGVVAALAGALLPSRHAASLDPARTLAG